MFGIPNTHECMMFGIPNTGVWNSKHSIWNEYVQEKLSESLACFGKKVF